MCGIFGSTIKYGDKKIVEKKLESMSHRGPDFLNFQKISDNLIFGHNRLAIVDLDSRSNQPFLYENISIVFNGEIYNFQDIRKELQSKGFVFRTTSDTEVVCAAYLAYGRQCLDKFNGMFAFVIYDPEKDILFGARDRLGKKPFYYINEERGFEFSSTLSALEIGNNFELCNESLTKYLYWNYVPEPYTPYKSVFKLPSATAFVYNLQDSVFETYRYWDLPETNNIEYQDIDQAKNSLKVLLKDAVSKRMISDVPLGVFLSGGVDSSLVAAIAQENSKTPINTFSVKFNEKGFDESQYAKEVAEKLKTNHTEIVCSYEEGIDFIKNFSEYYDEPFADSSAIPSLLLSKYTKQKVTVALSGDGGDETFMGYNIYDIIQKRQKIYKIPYGFRYIIAKVLNLIPAYRTKLIAKAITLKSVRDLYLSFYNTLNSSWIKAKEVNPSYVNYLNNNNKNLMEAISDFDTKTFLNGDCITKVERASMAFSLEVRSPLMDYKVIEFSRSIPTNFKYGDDGDKKHILKRVLYDYLPKEIFDRKKSGFSMPLGLWFRTILREFVLETFEDKNLCLVEDLIDKNKFLEIVDQHMKGEWDHTPRIWKVIVLINWIKSRRNVQTFS